MRHILLAALILTMAVPLAAGDALREDAATYAEQFGVDVEEAVRRLQLQRVAGDLEAALLAEEPEAFAGLWIEHAPRYRVVASFTNRAAEARLQARLGRGPLAGFVETRAARWTLAQLEARQAALAEQLEKAGEEHHSDIDVTTNGIELYTIDPVRTRQKLAAIGAPLPDGVRVRRVDRMTHLEAVGGGAAGSTCTFGFAVRSTTGELGLSTAGHCVPDDQYYNGLLLPFRPPQRWYDNWDIQWNSTCDIVDVTNVINSGIGPRAITATRSRTQQTVGSYVCKNGMITGRTCGTISSKNYDPGFGLNPTFIRVEGGGTDLSSEGDSGAPWFVENYAYGSHSGHPLDDDYDAYYMAINYITDIGVSVLTYDPGPGCNLPPIASLTYSAGGVQYSFDASNSRDLDGSIVSYFWDFGDGTTLTTTTPYAVHTFGGDSYNVTLTVTDNEGLSSYTGVDITTCGGFGQPSCFQ